MNVYCQLLERLPFPYGKCDLLTDFQFNFRSLIKRKVYAVVATEKTIIINSLCFETKKWIFENFFTLPFDAKMDYNAVVSAGYKNKWLILARTNKGPLVN